VVRPHCEERGGRERDENPSTFKEKGKGGAPGIFMSQRCNLPRWKKKKGKGKKKKPRPPGVVSPTVHLFLKKRKKKGKRGEQRPPETAQRCFFPPFEKKKKGGGKKKKRKKEEKGKRGGRDNSPAWFSSTLKKGKEEGEGKGEHVYMGNGFKQFPRIKKEKKRGGGRIRLGLFRRYDVNPLRKRGESCRSQS